jgi:glycerophosphoryl diester phosphodiesterase
MALFDHPIAHRGLHDRARGIIENTPSAFEAAIAAGYAIECDVQLSSDGVPFIFHDDDFDRLTSAKGASDAMPIAEVQKLVLTGSSSNDVPPTFEQFLRQTEGRALQMQIELKQQHRPGSTDALARVCAAALKNYKGPHTVESFDPNLLLTMRRHGYTGKLGIITYSFPPNESPKLNELQRFVAKQLLHYPVTRFDFISCQDTWLTAPMVRLFRALGMPVTTWTIKSEAQAAAVRPHADQLVFEGFLPASA